MLAALTTVSAKAALFVLTIFISVPNDKTGEEIIGLSKTMEMGINQQCASTPELDKFVREGLKAAENEFGDLIVTWDARCIRFDDHRKEEL